MLNVPEGNKSCGNAQCALVPWIADLIQFIQFNSNRIFFVHRVPFGAMKKISSIRLLESRWKQWDKNLWSKDAENRIKCRFFWGPQDICKETSSSWKFQRLFSGNIKLINSIDFPWNDDGSKHNFHKENTIFSFAILMKIHGKFYKNRNWTTERYRFSNKTISLADVKYEMFNLRRIWIFLHYNVYQTNLVFPPTRK